MPDQKAVQDILDTIALRYRGPGGAIAILKDGELIGQRVWGFADIDERVPLTAQTQMPICSITKQFVCAVLIDLQRNPTPAIAVKGDIHKQLSEALAELLPPEMTRDTGLTIEHLCDMQSGIRDYWAMTTLWGAKPDDEFLIERDCPPALDRTKSLHFQPGKEFSYSNVNFHILARILERVTGGPLAKLLAERILDPAGMATAFLCPNTANHPPPCVGYEGDEQYGYIPAVNRMEWSGDAGLVASLDDMIAYEKYLDRLSSDPQSWYRVAIQPHTFTDGTVAHYHYGLGHEDVDGIDTVGHGGALRGYRLNRRHVPEERLSVVVLFNHEADSSDAVNNIVRGILCPPKPVNSIVQEGPQPGVVIINYAGHPEKIQLEDPSNGRSSTMVATIEGDILRIERFIENQKLTGQRLVPQGASLKDDAFKGDYQCAEIDSVFHCIGEAGMLYGAFDGYLGRGPARPMRYIGGDVWALTCPRGLDAPAPGDWTLIFSRDESGAIKGFKIGCVLAKCINFVKH
ncbi:hypothetical protein N7512_008686 [Penicillium capsulatum]|nr:hypothetical protein N7512_008686 [Penicillium capsulatum]